jgi:ribose 5-phosphate isomerase RpiB
MVPYELAEQIVKVWLDTPFVGGRHALRIQEIDQP